MTKLQRGGGRRVRGEPDVYARKLLEQADGRLNLPIDARLDVGGANPVAVPVLKGRKRKAPGGLREPETYGGTTRHGLSSGEPKPCGKESCGSVSA